MAKMAMLTTTGGMTYIPRINEGRTFPPVLKRTMEYVTGVAIARVVRVLLTATTVELSR